MILERNGMVVVVAADGAAAVDAFRARAAEIDLVLLDLGMPGMSAEAVVDALRAVRADARIVACSGEDEETIAQRFSGRGLAGILRKPFRAEQLVAAVRMALISPKG
jgi:DNA-binding response OmpR family regulator